MGSTAARRQSANDRQDRRFLGVGFHVQQHTRSSSNTRVDNDIEIFVLSHLTAISIYEDGGYCEYLQDRLSRAETRSVFAVVWSISMNDERDGRCRLHHGGFISNKTEAVKFEIQQHEIQSW